MPCLMPNRVNPSKDLLLRIFLKDWKKKVVIWLYLLQTVTETTVLPPTVTNFRPQILSGTAFILTVFLTAPGIVIQSYPAFAPAVFFPSAP